MPTTTTMTETTGVDGRVKKRTGGADVIIAGITSWELNKPVEVAKSLHFESPANAAGVVYPANKIPTVGDWTVSIAGITSLAADPQGTDVDLKDGKKVILDLVVSKGGSVGYPSCTVVVKNFKIGQKFGNELCTFSCEGDGYGVPPTFGAVS